MPSPRVALRSILPLTLGIAALTPAPIARADAVDPPPLICPPGWVGAASHRGSRCVRKTPSNCPPGWYGIEGGRCVVELCDPKGKGHTCRGGRVCVAQPVCFEKITPVHHGEPDPWRAYDDAVGIIDPGAPCDPPRITAAGHVCVPPGESPVPFVPPLGDWENPGPPRPSGCARSCTIDGARADHGLLAAFALIAAFTLTRRRERRD